MRYSDQSVTYDDLYRWAVASTVFQRSEARDWLRDALGVLWADRIAGQGGIAVVSAVNRHYNGGWPAFVKACGD